MGKRILILTDGKAGHENQSKAFARALGFEFDLFEIHFKSPLSKSVSYLLDHLHIKAPSLFDRTLPTGDYAAVVGAGSGTFYALKVVAKKMGIPCAAILYPSGYVLDDFTCVLAPKFDNPKKLKNIIEIPANLVAIDKAFYNEATNNFLARYSPKKKNAVAVIVGGPNPYSHMDVAWMKKELDNLFATTPNDEHWVTTSRRTPEKIEELIDTYSWDYKLIYSRDKFNPIPAFVSLARSLVVTAESTGMLSEACTCGNAEVHVLDNLKEGNHKFRRFVENLRNDKYVDGAEKIDLSKYIYCAAELMGLK